MGFAYMGTVIGMKLKFYCDCKDPQYEHVDSLDKVNILKEWDIQDMGIALWHCRKCGKYRWAM
jgi:hypothetical protein